MDQPSDNTGTNHLNGTNNTEPVFDRAYRINELSKIEQNIAKLLRSAGEAMQALTLKPAQSSDPSKDPASDSIEQRKQIFSRATSEYFAALSYVDVHLRREIYALEEANIIPVDIPKENVATAPTGPQMDGFGKATSGAGPLSSPAAGGMGNLDVGWLNSRNDKVGKDMQAELWAQVKELLDGTNLDDLLGTSTRLGGANADGSGE